MTEQLPPWRLAGQSHAQPVAQPQAQQESDTSAVLRELDDPATSPARLQQIALEHPELGSRIASHPNCYPELSEWVEQHAQAAAAHHAAAAPSEPVPKPRKLLKVFGIAAAIVLPLITAASITIPVVAGLSERESSADTLKVMTAPDPFADAEVIGEETTQRFEHYDPSKYQMDWKIPVDAPIDTFPLELSLNAEYGWYQCSEQQLEWLSKHAEPFSIFSPERSFDITVHNSASAGASLPIGNIRFLGEEVSSTPWLYFGCPGGGRGAVGGVQLLLVGVDGEEALYGEPVAASGDDVMPEGSPVTLNLAPGEVSVITLTRDESVDRLRRYEGRFIADVLDGSERTVVLADNVTFRQERVPTYTISIQNDPASPDFQTLRCGVADPDSFESDGSYAQFSTTTCTPQEAVEHLRLARQYVAAR